MSASCGQAVLTGEPLRLAGRPPTALWREGTGVAMVSERLAARWEAVYREYGFTSDMVSNSEPGDGAVARHMARASQDLAIVWQELASEPDMPWWLVAGLGAAAQAFEHQARDWAARARHVEWPAGEHGRPEARRGYWL